MGRGVTLQVTIGVFVRGQTPVDLEDVLRHRGISPLIDNDPGRSMRDIKKTDSTFGPLYPPRNFVGNVYKLAPAGTLYGKNLHPSPPDFFKVYPRARTCQRGSPPA